MGPTKREAAKDKEFQRKLDAMQKKLDAATGGTKGDTVDKICVGTSAQRVDLARLYKWAQTCKQEWGSDSVEYEAANAKYQAARDEKDSNTPHSVQLLHAKQARERLEKEVETSAKEISWYEKQLEEAKTKQDQKKEQLQVAKAKEQELKVQDFGARESPEFLTAMQKQFEGSVDGSGVSKQEYQGVFELLGKVMANAKQEDVDMARDGGGAPRPAAEARGGEGARVPDRDDDPDLTPEEFEWLKAGGVPGEATVEQRKRWQEICTSLSESASKRQRRG